MVMGPQNTFSEDGTKDEEGSSASPKAGAKAKALTAKKVVLRGVHSHIQNRDSHAAYF